MFIVALYKGFCRGLHKKSRIATSSFFFNYGKYDKQYKSHNFFFLYFFQCFCVLAATRLPSKFVHVIISSFMICLVSSLKPSTDKIILEIVAGSGCPFKSWCDFVLI